MFYTHRLLDVILISLTLFLSAAPLAVAADKCSFLNLEAHKRLRIPMQHAELLEAVLDEKEFSEDDKEKFYERLKLLPPITFWEEAYQFVKVSTLDEKFLAEEIIDIVYIAGTEELPDLLERAKKNELNHIEKRALILLLTHQWNAIWRIRNHSKWRQALMKMARPISSILDYFYNDRRSFLGDARTERSIRSYLQNMPRTFAAHYAKLKGQLTKARSERQKIIEARKRARGFQSPKPRRYLTAKKIELDARITWLEREIDTTRTNRSRWIKEAQEIVESSHPKVNWFRRLLPTKTEVVSAAESLAVATVLLGLTSYGIHYRFIRDPDLPSAALPTEFIDIGNFINIEPPEAEQQLLHNVEDGNLDQAIETLQNLPSQP